MSSSDDALLGTLAVAGLAIATGGFGLAAASAATPAMAVGGAGALPAATAGAGLFGTGISTSTALLTAGLGASLLSTYQQSQLADRQYTLQAAMSGAEAAEKAVEIRRKQIRTEATIRNQAGNDGALESDGTVQGALQAARDITDQQLHRLGVAHSDQQSLLALENLKSRNLAMGSAVGSVFDYARDLSK